MKQAQGLADMSSTERALVLKAALPLQAKCLTGQEITDQDKAQAIRTVLCDPRLPTVIAEEALRNGTSTPDATEAAIGAAFLQYICSQPTPEP
jgi:hypothetical protein